MAAKYSDYIKMQDFLPVYDMTDETPEMWRTFIPTKQFCDLLSRSVTAITSSEISKRRSMWVRGTFGTGKSHASSVVRHLLYPKSTKRIVESEFDSHTQEKNLFPGGVKRCRRSLQYTTLLFVNTEADEVSVGSSRS